MIQVIANIEGDLLDSNMVADFSAKKLLIPSLKMWHHKSYPPEYVVSKTVLHNLIL